MRKKLRVFMQARLIVTTISFTLCIILCGSSAHYDDLSTTQAQQPLFLVTGLSQKGRIDFAHQYNQINKQLSPQLSAHCGTTSVQQTPFALSNICSAHINADPITVSCGIDPLSCFNLICAVPRISSAILDAIMKRLERVFDTHNTY